ncbi:MAG: YdcH family protein [Deltaproteobacteria bacterium]|nr:YdcH family protein [Deltaproteobacteria bacterium]
MEKTDLELIARYKGEDGELASLWEEHLAFERQLEKLERKPFLSPEEQLERNELKKRKLAGRDQIEQRLDKYRYRVARGAHSS